MEQMSKAHPTWKEHRLENLQRDAAESNIVLPRFRPRTGLALHFVLYVNPGSCKEDAVRNVRMVTALLGMLEFGEGNATVCYGLGSDAGFLFNHHPEQGKGEVSWLRIESFDATFFKERNTDSFIPKTTDLNDVVIQVPEGEGKRTETFIRKLMENNGYETQIISSDFAAGGNKAWRFYMPQLLPCNTITVIEYIDYK
jgi:hypothetical protein